MGLRKFRKYWFYSNYKSENYCRLLSFLVLYSIFLFTTCAPIGKTPPKAEKGVLDLRDWNFDTSRSLLGGNINLDGEWEFYWNEFPEGKGLSLPDGKREYLEVPNSWKGAVVKQSNGSNEIISDRRRGVGYATYKLKILIGKDLPLSMRLSELNLHKSEVDLVKEIEKAFHVYDNYIIGKMTVKKEYPKELKYNCVAENFTGVWKNFIFNAVQATYNTQKKLEVKLEKVDVLPERLKSYRASGVVDDKYFQYQESNPWVLVSFQDWGVGIKEELQSKVFTPFFTTKSLGEGIGLGLYVCKKIVSEHKGLIFFNSREGTTEFIVALPDTI